MRSPQPSNFALIALFRSGDLHKLTANFATEPEETMHQLIIVLSHLFGRVLRRAQSVESIEKTVRNSPSKIILPPLPDNIINTLQKHHESIIAIFSVYAKEYSQQHSKTLGEDIAFPVSGRKVAPSASNADAAGSLASRLEQTKIPIDSRSPFVANSGHGDKYSSISELAATTRAGLVLTKHAVPSMTFLTSTETSLDAYVVDFYRHGQVEALVRDNGIRKSDVWFYVRPFLSYLSTSSLTTRVSCKTSRSLSVRSRLRSRRCYSERTTRRKRTTIQTTVEMLPLEMRTTWKDRWRTTLSPSLPVSTSASLLRPLRSDEN